MSAQELSFNNKLIAVGDIVAVAAKNYHSVVMSGGVVITGVNVGKWRGSIEIKTNAGRVIQRWPNQVVVL